MNLIADSDTLPLGCRVFVNADEMCFQGQIIGRAVITSERHDREFRFPVYKELSGSPIGWTIVGSLTQLGCEELADAEVAERLGNFRAQTESCDTRTPARARSGRG